MKNNASLYIIDEYDQGNNIINQYIIPFVKMNKNKLESYMNKPYCDVFCGKYGAVGIPYTTRLISNQWL